MSNDVRETMRATSDRSRAALASTPSARMLRRAHGWLVAALATVAMPASADAAAKPDLTIIDVQVRDGSRAALLPPMHDGKIAVLVRVENLGTVKPKSNVEVQCHLRHRSGARLGKQIRSGKKTASKRIGRAQDGTDKSTQWIGVSFPKEKAGSYAVVCQLDRGNKIAESDEKNNVKRADFQVRTWRKSLMDLDLEVTLPWRPHGFAESFSFKVTPKGAVAKQVVEYPIREIPVELRWFAKCTAMPPGKMAIGGLANIGKGKGARRYNFPEHITGRLGRVDTIKGDLFYGAYHGEQESGFAFAFSKRPAAPLTKHWDYMRERDWKKQPEKIRLLCKLSAGAFVKYPKPSEFDKRVMHLDWMPAGKPYWTKSFDLTVVNEWRHAVEVQKKKDTKRGVSLSNPEVSAASDKEEPLTADRNTWAKVSVWSEGKSETRAFDLRCRALKGNSEVAKETIAASVPIEGIKHHAVLLGRLAAGTYTIECTADPDEKLSGDPDRSNNTRSTQATVNR